MAEIPARLIAGDSWTLTLGAARYAPPWTLALVLVPETGGNPIILPAALVDGVWMVTAGFSVTDAYTPGAYRWSVTAADVANDLRETVSCGAVHLVENPASGADPRSQAERDLAAVRAVMSDPAWIGAESYTIEGRSLARRSVADLRSLESRLVAIVRREKGGGPFQSFPVRF